MNTTFSLGEGSQAKQPQPEPEEGGPSQVTSRLFRWIGRSFYFAALLGLGIFGTYILLRGTGATLQNFDQWHDLVSGLPMQTSADWIANVGIGMHYFMGAVLVLARETLHDEFDIDHATLQVEPVGAGGGQCGPAGW